MPSRRWPRFLPNFAMSRRIFSWEEISDYRLGGQILHESNPGDYSDDDDSDEIEYDVFEV